MATGDNSNKFSTANAVNLDLDLVVGVLVVSCILSWLFTSTLPLSAVLRQIESHLHHIHVTQIFQVDAIKHFLALQVAESRSERLLTGMLTIEMWLWRENKSVLCFSYGKGEMLAILIFFSRCNYQVIKLENYRTNIVHEKISQFNEFEIRK